MSLERLGVGTYKTTCAADTEYFGELIAPCLEDGDVLILTGGLGVGKTHFTKGVSRGLGDGHMVTSPTFALMAVHDQGRIPLFHFDLYRLEHAYELEDTGIFDVLGYEGACLLEWGEQSPCRSAAKTKKEIKCLRNFIVKNFRQSKTENRCRRSKTCWKLARKIAFIS